MVNVTLLNNITKSPNNALLNITYWPISNITTTSLGQIQNHLLLSIYAGSELCIFYRVPCILHLSSLGFCQKVFISESFQR